MVLGITLFGLDHKTIEHWIEFIATLLIAGGVYAELRFGRKASEAHKELRALSDHKIADATAKAHERATALEKEAAEARERTAEIERITQWRRLSREQYDIIFSDLRFKLEVDITIICVHDPEAIMFANGISDLFRNARATKVDRIAHPMPVDGKIEFGLLISSDPEIYATIVRETFEKAGIEIRQIAPAPGGQARMTLYVGHKEQ